MSNTCKMCGEFLITHDDHSGQYCPYCTWDIDHYQENEPYTYEQFLSDINKLHATQPKKGDLRLGQIFFNELCKVRPAIAEQLRGSMLDPFYKERITQVVSDFVKERW